MFIGIDASHANKVQRTGVEEYCWQVIQEFKKIIPGDVRVVLYSNNKLLPELDVLPANWEVKVLEWPLRKMWSQIRLAFELWKNPPDVYFSPGQLLPLFAPKNSVVMVHDSAFEAYPSAYRFLGRQYLKWMNRLIVKKAKLILTSTEFNKGELLNYYKGLDANKIKITPLAYNDKKFNLDGIKGENIFGRYILSIGRLEEKKNTKMMIEVFGLLKLKFSDLKLVLIGNPGFGYAIIKKAITESKYSQDIIEYNKYKKNKKICPDMITVLKNGQVFIFPSIYEGFGIPPLEAMAVGVPVIVSNISALREVDGEAADYVDPNNPQLIVTKIEKLLVDENYRKEKINLGLEQVKKYSWEKTARLTWEEIKK